MLLQSSFCCSVAQVSPACGVFARHCSVHRLALQAPYISTGLSRQQVLLSVDVLGSACTWNTQAAVCTAQASLPCRPGQAAACLQLGEQRCQISLNPPFRLSMRPCAPQANAHPRYKLTHCLTPAGASQASLAVLSSQAGPDTGSCYDLVVVDLSALCCADIIQPTAMTSLAGHIDRGTQPTIDLCRL